MSGDNCDRSFPEGLNGSRLPAFRQLNLRLTKGFGIGGLDLTAYLDARNVLNFRNIIQVFTQTDDIVNDGEREPSSLGNSEDNRDEAARSGVAVGGRRYHRPHASAASRIRGRLRQLGDPGRLIPRRRTACT